MGTGAIGPGPLQFLDEGMDVTMDYRIRKTGSVFYVWQRIGSGWQRLCYPYASRGEALDAVRTYTDGKV